MVNTFDPDALIVGGGAIETGPEFQQWFVSEIRKGMPTQREEQADIPIFIMPNGDTAGRPRRRHRGRQARTPDWSGLAAGRRFRLPPADGVSPCDL